MLLASNSLSDFCLSAKIGGDTSEMKDKRTVTELRTYKLLQQSDGRRTVFKVN